MSDQEQHGEESPAPAESSDSEAVQAALKGIPGLSDSMGNRPAPGTGGDPADETSQEEEQDPTSMGDTRPGTEDSETVQRALKQLGLQ